MKNYRHQLVISQSVGALDTTFGESNPYEKGDKNHNYSFHINSKSARGKMTCQTKI